MGDESAWEYEGFSRQLEPLMTKLAKACLLNKPDDLDMFCYKFFAARVGRDDVHSQGSSRTRSKKRQPCPPNARAADDDLDDNEEELAVDCMAALIRSKSTFIAKASKNYESTDEDDDDSYLGDDGIDMSPVSCDLQRSRSRAVVQRKSPLKDLRDTDDNRSQFKSEDDAESVRTCQSFGSDDDDFGGEGVILDSDEEQYRGDVKELSTSTSRHHAHSHAHSSILHAPRRRCDVFEAAASRAEKDPRMRRLFETWDDDGNGSVDLMELVIALHKFNSVMEEGNDIARASAALVMTEDANEEEELNMAQFARFICHFCEDAYGQPFEEMATHMLAVANASSERAALAAASGGDISQIVADDEAETEFLKETVRGVADSVSDNLKKIRTSRRVNFK